MASSAADSTAPMARLSQRPAVRATRTGRPGGPAMPEPSAARSGARADYLPDGGYFASDRVRFWPAACVVALHILCFAAIFGYRQHVAHISTPTAISVVAIPAPPPPMPRMAPPEVVVDVPLPFVPPPDVRIARPPVPTITATTVEPPPVPVRTVASPAAAGPANIAIASADNLVATLLDGRPPDYPRQSRRLHEEGRVLLMVTVGTDGRVQDVRISQSSGHERLDQAALRAIRSWRWKPFLRNGSPIIVAGLVEIPFVLARGHRSGHHGGNRAESLS